jgi:hypothetical protein
MLMWRRDVVAWLSYKYQARHGCMDSDGPQIASVVRSNKKEKVF